MEDLRKFELNNKTLEKFDDIMSYHLDKVEELVIKEVLTNSKLYNIISLCINVKTLVIEGDLRVDVNKIMFNICKPELLETLILNSVKLPTTKTLEKFTNIQTISLTNITFSNISGFFEKLPNKEIMNAINLSNSDLGKKSISICGIFPNLKFLNIDGLLNCKFDDFTFLANSKKIERFDFFGNEIGFEVLKDLTKKKYTKNIDVKLKTPKKSYIDNRFEINSDGEISLTVNSSDLDEITKYLPFSKLQNLFLVIENEDVIDEYMRKLRKVKDKVKITIKDITCLDLNGVQDLQDKLEIKNIGILDYGSSKVKSYSIEDYILIREKFDEIVNSISNYSDDIEKFEELYKYLKNNVQYAPDEECNVKTFFLDNKSNYNLYANCLECFLKELKIKSKIIKGISYDVPEVRSWNQVKLKGDWYNVDLGRDMEFKQNKKIWQIGVKEILFDDETFLKNHVVQSGKPEVCKTQFAQKKKEIKDTPKKIGTFKKFIYKIKSIFNKQKALPDVDESKKED